MEAEEFLKLDEKGKKEALKGLTPKELWQLVISIGRRQEPQSKGITNKFDKDDINTVIATMEFFGATDVWMQQTVYDLITPRYRLFDLLGMSIMGRNDDNRQQNNTALKVLIWSYLRVNGIPKKFIEDLRCTDYQMDESYDCIQDIIEW